MLSGGTSTKNERAAESMAVIEGEISSLANDGPTEEELDKAKKYLIGSYALRFDTSTKIATSSCIYRRMVLASNISTNATSSSRQ